MMQDCLSAAAAYARHSEARPTQPLLIDLSEITGYETDYVQILQAMARLPDYLWHKGAERLVVCLAPHALSRQISAAVARAIWNCQRALPASPRPRLTRLKFLAFQSGACVI
jgi:hypothetical protein